MTVKDENIAHSIFPEIFRGRFFSFFLWVLCGMMVASFFSVFLNGTDSLRRGVAGVGLSSSTSSDALLTNFTAVYLTTSQVKLNWVVSNGSTVTIDKVYNGSGVWESVVTDLTELQYIDSDTRVGSLVYRISACAGTSGVCGASVISSRVELPDRIPPSTPEGFQATSTSPTSVLLSWVSSSDNIALSGYRITQGIGHKPVIVTSELQYEVKDIASDSLYEFQIVAVDISGNVSPESTISVSTPVDPRWSVVPTVISSVPPIVTSPPSGALPVNVSNITAQTPLVKYFLKNLSPCSANGTAVASFDSLPSVGGNLVVSPLSGIQTKLTVSGNQVELSTGKYEWKASPPSGYRIEGPVAGIFTVNCPTLEQVLVKPNTIQGAQKGAPLQPISQNISPKIDTRNQALAPALSAIIILQNSRVVQPKDAISQSVQVVLIPRGVSSERVDFFITDASGKQKALGRGKGVLLDGYTLSGVDLDASALEPGVYSLSARASDLSGHSVVSPLYRLVVERSPTPKKLAVQMSGTVSSLSDSSTTTLLENVDQRSLIAVETLVVDRPSSTFLDSDKDGIIDFDEVQIYRTDPTQGDTDGDGKSDSEEILQQTNPLIFNQGVGSKISDLVLSEDPRSTGIVSTTTIHIDQIELGSNTSSTSPVLVFQGRALPFSYVNLYIFSEPIIITVQADESGSWKYTLEKNLPDGNHESYSTINDNSGKIIVKSPVLPFVKTAEAITVGAQAQADDVESPNFFLGNAFYAILGLLIGVIGVAISVLGYLVRGRNVKVQESSLPPETPL